MRKYFIDFFVTVLKEDGTQENIAIEIKPYSQTIKPKKGRRKREDVYLRECYDYQVNQDKWKFADLWCKQHNFTFKTMTEYDLGLKIKK